MGSSELESPEQHVRVLIHDQRKYRPVAAGTLRMEVLHAGRELDEPSAQDQG
jgi:hypothetical protein